MADKPENLTFLTDPAAYQARSDEVCVLIPVGLSTAEELLDALSEGLPLGQRGVHDWNSLYDLLRAWDEWQYVPRRAVIVHSDLPLIHAGGEGVFDLQTYVEILGESIAEVRERNAAETDPSRQRELVAIFPVQMEEQLRQVLNSPPAWYVTRGFLADDHIATLQRNPSWPTILRDLDDLNGVTSEICELTRKDLGKMTVHYNKHTRAYCVLYEAPGQETWQVASEAETLTLPPQISFASASQALDAFFTAGKRADTLHWFTLSSSAYYDLLNQLQRTFYCSDEEMLVEKHINRTRPTIEQGVEEALEKGAEGYALAYWQDVLSQAETSLSQRLAALCVIGLSTLPEAPELLRPFLQSPVKQERWVSARFCGLWRDEEALPILLSMLTDELPLAEQKRAREDDHYWYNTWRRYAPRLLRNWQTPEVDQQLRQALTVWVQAEPRFDPDDELWELCEGEICYELGYRGASTILSELSLTGKQKQALSYQLERGRRAQQKHWTAFEEYTYK